MKAIIYYRKSTDRDDKQANSLEHQLSNCRKVAQLHWFEVLKEIWESKSAKTEWTRDWFNELIKICKASNIDYIIIDEPKRLSRNNIDTSRIIDLLDKKQIKGILWNTREYKADNSRDKFLLQLDLSLSKMDNEDRAKDISDKMTTCINNTGRFLGKAPFWYKNITIKKWHKEIVLDNKEAKIVKEIFNLRIENKAFTTIANIIKSKYGSKVDLYCEWTRIHQLVWKKFYYWIFTWKWKEIMGSHKPIITKDMYDRANWIWKWVHEKKETLLLNEKEKRHRNYYLKWFVKDYSSIHLLAYVKKWNIYYWSQSRSDERVSINQNILFEKIWEFIKQFEDVNKVLENIDKEIILNLIRGKKESFWTELHDIDSQIKRLKMRKEKLLDLKLDETISDEVYLIKNNNIENQIKELIEEKDNINNDDFEEKTQIMIELAGKLYQSYFSANKEGKAYIVKKLMIELFVSNKKELKIEESNLFKSSKMLNFSNGIPKEFDSRTFSCYISKNNLEDLKDFYTFLINIK